MWCIVLRSKKKPDTYLYLKENTSLQDLPESLQMLFTPHEQAMKLWLKPEQKLARLSGQALMKHLDEPGYYLQLPPAHQDILNPRVHSNEE
ncbi:MAG: hypothetical protein HLUCCO02_00910 [Idiomarinaceae bacterium HL-53]|nr:MAG: hypothetical protein HLUCCO02_00910 [Idiomarinaceae bacterium HL-53]CUS48594.1 hypothetical protein Ga0003345_1553 [Idiomarinaceae bacterium HL-53]